MLFCSSNRSRKSPVPYKLVFTLAPPSTSRNMSLLITNLLFAATLGGVLTSTPPFSVITNARLFSVKLPKKPVLALLLVHSSHIVSFLFGIQSITWLKGDDGNSESAGNLL